MNLDDRLIRWRRARLVRELNRLVGLSQLIQRRAERIGRELRELNAKSPPPPGPMAIPRPRVDGVPVPVPRTMAEAFGQGAKLDPYERRVGRWIAFGLVGVGLAATVAAVAWGFLSLGRVL